MSSGDDDTTRTDPMRPLSFQGGGRTWPPDSEAQTIGAQFENSDLTRTDPMRPLFADTDATSPFPESGEHLIPLTSGREVVDDWRVLIAGLRPPRFPPIILECNETDGYTTARYHGLLEPGVRHDTPPREPLIVIARPLHSHEKTRSSPSAPISMQQLARSRPARPSQSTKALVFLASMALTFFLLFFGLDRAGYLKGPFTKSADAKRSSSASSSRSATAATARTSSLTPRDAGTRSTSAQ